MTIKIDLKGIVDKAGVLNKILNELDVPRFDKHHKNQNFDGFSSYMSNLATESNIWLSKSSNIDISDIAKKTEFGTFILNDDVMKVFIERFKQKYPELSSVHLDIYNANEFKENNFEAYSTLLEVLDQLEKPKHVCRSDGAVNKYDWFPLTYTIY